MERPPEHDPQQLLAQRDFVRALAAQLVGGANADDLSQEAWLRVLDEGRHRGVRELRPWLRRVLQRLASNLRRGERRRRARDRQVGEAHDTAGPSVDDVLACEEARRHVVAAVLALDEPFRRTVLARYYEGASSEEIARRERIEVATVRSRLKRAHDRLRAQLDDRHGGRAAWAAPLGWWIGAPGAGVTTVSTWIAMSTTKKLAGVAAVLLLLSVSLWWQPWAGKAEPAPGQPSSAAGGEVAAAPSPSQPTRQVAAMSPDAPSAVTFVPPPLIDQTLRDVPVRVLDRATLRPVAGAELRFLPYEIDYHHPAVIADRALIDQARSPDWIREVGERVVTADDGTAVVHLPQGGGRVIASRGELWSDAKVEPEHLLPGERAVVWLEQMRWLRVRLVDAAGVAVVGMPLLVSTADDPPITPGSGGYESLSAPSGADGIVRIPCRDDRSAVRVRPRMVGPDVKEVALELPEALDRVTEVGCASTCKLTIEVRTPSGRLWPGELVGEIRPLVPGGAAWTTTSTMATRWNSMVSGVYRFTDVQVASSYHVSVHPAWGIPVEMRAETDVVAPRHAGEEAVVTLTLPDEPCVVRARFVAADGSALPEEARLFGSMQLLGTRWDVFSYAALLDGVLEWVVPRGSVGGGVVHARGMHGRSGVETSCEWRLSAPAHPGLQELGTLRLVAPGVIVAGRLDIGPEPWRGPPVNVQVEAEQADGSWRSLGDCAIDPAREVAFELMQACDAERVRLSIQPSAHVLPAEPVVVARGTTDVVLPVLRGVALRARVLAPVAFANALRCTVTPRDGAGLPTMLEEREPVSRATARPADFDGEVATFVWPALPPGHYDVEVRAPGMAQPLAVVSDVRVAPGVVDPRLETIDVRRAARVLKVSVIATPDGAGALERGGVLAFEPDPDGERCGMLFDADGRAELLLGAQPVDLLVVMPGCRLWRATGVTAEVVEVTMQPCVEVPFRLAPRVAEALAGLPVTVSLRPTRADRAADDAPTNFWRPGQRRPEVSTTWIWLECPQGTGSVLLPDAALATGRLPMAASGTFRIEMVVHGPHRSLTLGEMYLPRRPRWPLLPRIVEIDVDAPVPFEVDLEPEALQNLIENVARQR
ncbi:MAG: sigma-70 family RNA polymerase sigma factor [Planctomycetes bacterium]|nr:sigma-70 family RNA polymerase sigma factor [Planctomycetota bacterium]